VRYHVCWGSWNGPHTNDVAMKDIVDLVLQVPAGSYLFEAANPRHEHEWRVWGDVKPENVAAGTDCGFAQGPYIQRVHPTIMWAKLAALAESAALASEREFA
jgi:5-methyltetrahydropteroyltriglutamate--homocysteine methyltransferase